MIYLVDVQSDMGMCAIYLGEFTKFANDAHTKIYMEDSHVNAVCDWGEMMGIA